MYSFITSDPVSKYFLSGASARNGVYIYDLTGSASATAEQREARCGCVKWYARDLVENWQAPDDVPCPCTRFQANNDGRFIESVDVYFNLANGFQANFTTTSTELWEYDTCKSISHLSEIS